MDEYTEDTSATVTISLPRRDDIETLTDLANECEASDQRGAKSLYRSITKYLNHVRLCDTFWERAQTSANSMNGIRTPNQRTGSRKRSVRAVSEKYYNTLTTSQLRMHCDLFDLDFDAYNSIDEIIEALVQMNIAQQNGQ